MELEKRNLKKLYELIPTNKSLTFKGAILKKTRVMIGRSENCDVVIESAGISAVHAIIEIGKDKFRIYDMNSTNGTYVNGEKVVVKDINIGDRVLIANVELSLKNYMAQDLPPVLEQLEPDAGGQVQLPTLPQEVKTRMPVVGLPQAPSVSKDAVPYIVYPLAADPKAEFSEYIFEDVETLYPIFKYDIGVDSVEVMILHDGKIYSVDYLPGKDATYSLAGRTNKVTEVEFPYLAAKEKQPIVDVKNGEIFVNNMFGWDILHLASDKVKEIASKNELIVLGPEDIIKYSKGEIEIYIRRTDAPPKVASAPIMRRDKSLKKYILLFLLLIFLPVIFLTNFEVDKEMEKDKAPERIATILYKAEYKNTKKDAVKKTKNEKKVAQKSQAKKVEQKKDTPKQEVKKVTSQKPKPTTKKVGQKTAKKVVDAKKAKATPSKVKVAAKKPGKVKKTRNFKGPTTRKTTTRTRSRSKVKTFKGHVDVYKSPNFKSTLSSLMAKGGSVSAVSANSASASFDDTKTLKVGGGNVNAIKTANVASDTGTLTGAATGKLSASRGAEGLSAKKSLYTAGIPSETVVLGSMDPDIIRRILRENLPQFRSCYQQELDRTGKGVAGVVPLTFVIGASGHVTRAAVKSGSTLPTGVQKCVQNVLYGIRFPRPMGGGTVQVDQPMNFYPKR